MTRRMMSAALMALTLSWTVPVAHAAAQQTTATEEAKKAGEDAKDATKHAAKATAKGTKHVAKKTARGAKKVAEKTKEAVAPASVEAVCQDGTTQTGRSRDLACDDHGGVRR